MKMTVPERERESQVLREIAEIVVLHFVFYKNQDFETEAGCC